jgi:hypothetical protein
MPLDCASRHIFCCGNSGWSRLQDSYWIPIFHILDSIYILFNLEGSEVHTWQVLLLPLAFDPIAVCTVQQGNGLISLSMKLIYNSTNIASNCKTK